MIRTARHRTETVAATGCCPPFDPASWQAMEHVSGTFLARVFEGPFRQAGQWARQARCIPHHPRFGADRIE